MRSRLYLAVAVLLASLAVWGWVKVKILEHAEVEQDLKILHAQGWKDARVKGPSIPDLPHGAKPIVVVEGRVSPLPRGTFRGSEGIPASPLGPPSSIPIVVPSVPRETSEPMPWPVEGDLGGSCRVEVVRVGHKALGRAWWSGTLQGPDGQEMLKRGPILASETDVTVAPEVVKRRRLALRYFAGPAVTVGVDGRVYAGASVGWGLTW